MVAKSPLTGLLNDALASSHFAIQGKLTGNDAIVVRGACEEPSVLLVDGDGARMEPADELWGLSSAAAEERLRERLGPAWRVAAIGPAGERLVRFATVSHDGRHAGRGGLGAVMGAKRLKAVAVRGAGVKPHVADAPAVLAAAKALRELSFGPATEKYRELGTLANLLSFNAINTLPTRNFSAASFEGAPRLAAEELHELRHVARDSCASCTIGCEHIYASPGGGTHAGGVRERVRARPALRGVRSRRRARGEQLCDDLGIDTISAGGTLAWAMECAERGLIDAPWLRFGDGDALMRGLQEIGSRDGLGDLLAEGSRRAAARGGRRVRGLRSPREGARAAGLRAAHAARDGARAGRERPRCRPQPLRRLRGRPLGRARPARRRRSRTWRPPSRPRTARPSWTRSSSASSCAACSTTRSPSGPRCSRP